MKFYNPFKWHIVQDGQGEIYVRRWEVMGWYWLRNYGTTWIQNLSSVFESPAAAKIAIDNYNTRIAALKNISRASKTFKVLDV